MKYMPSWLDKVIKGLSANIDLWVTLCITVYLFLSAFGLRVLDVNDLDLVVGGGDFTNSYLGSVFYRIDAWRWPPLTMQNVAYPFGMSAYGADIGPLISFIFKVLHTVFGASPEWQFVGLWTLICYILQAYASVLIFRHIFTNKLSVIVSSLFFICAPIMLVRVFVHINLQPHFLILFPMLLWLNNKLGIKEWFYIGVLYSLSLLTCPYFLPMQTGFFALLWYQKLFVEKQLKYSHFIMALLCLAGVCLFWMYMLGVLTMTYKMNPGGWERYGLNLAALFIPGWSKPPIPWADPMAKIVNYDIDAYFGFGVFILIFLSLPAFKNLFKKETWVHHWQVILLIAGLFFFALSPRLRYNDTILFEYQPDTCLAWLGNTFRYSARFFWPIWYLVVFFVMKAFYTCWKKKAVWLLIPILIIQLFDVQILLGDKIHFVNYWNNNAHELQISWTENRWQQLVKKYPSFFYISHRGYEDLWRRAIKYHHNVSYGFLNRPHPKLNEYARNMRSQILSGYLDAAYKDYLLVLDEPTMEKMKKLSDINPAVRQLLSHVELVDKYNILEYQPGMEILSNRFDAPMTIPAQHTGWKDNLIQISPYRLYRALPSKPDDYATIISFNKDELIIEWDEWGQETFKRGEDGVYHFQP